jgi:hypothetical protein
MPMWLIWHEKTRLAQNALQQLSDCFHKADHVGQFLSDSRFAARRDGSEGRQRVGVKMMMSSLRA